MTGWDIYFQTMTIYWWANWLVERDIFDVTGNILYWLLYLLLFVNLTWDFNQKICILFIGKILISNLELTIIFRGILMWILIYTGIAVIVPQLKRGFVVFSIDFKIESNYYYYIRNNIVYSNMNNLKMRNHNLQI